MFLRPQVEEEDEDRSDPVYAWEGNVETTWLKVRETEEGKLECDAMDQDEHLRRQQHKANRQKLALGQSVRRGLIRYVYLAIDLSSSMREPDLKPDRLRYSLKVAQEFVKEYFDQNPISQLGVLVTRKGEAERVTELSANPKGHIQKLQDLGRTERPEGNASLQNLLDLAVMSLKAIPDYGCREVVLICGSLTTCDPGDIFDTLKKLVKHRVRVSIISLAAEMYICRRIADDTNGTYGTILDAKHFEDLLMAQVAPPPTIASNGPAYMDMVLMGFPNRSQSKTPTLAFDGSNPPQSTRTAHLCPRCKARVVDLPTTCNICNLPLVSSSHLARSYHHLFPVPPYIELTPKDAPQANHCQGCRRHFDVTSDKVVRLRCPTCLQVFCLDCDIWIHESLHNCPGCR